MDSIADGHKSISERLVTSAVVTIITLTSIVLMLSCTSPELSWDEADYASNTTASWRFLWSRFDYERHGHGPMTIYLAKLGQQILPAGTFSIEVRLRLFNVLVASVAVGLLYWMLRRCFRTSRAAALAGTSLLLFSVIRLEETNIIGPHHLMLACTLAIVALGYHWRDRPTLQAALGLGAVIGFGALSMAYVIPAALFWAVAVALSGKGWFAWDRASFKVSWGILGMLLTAGIILLALWPPGVIHHRVLTDFLLYTRYPPFPTLVGSRYGFPSRSAVIYWLAHLDAPILVFSFPVILLALWKAFSSGRLSSKQRYLTVFLVFFLITMLAAHLAGARNMLQFVGVLCLATGALFDEALGHRTKLVWVTSAAVIILGALNLIWHFQSSSYTPYLGTNGFRGFLTENKKRAAEKSKALVAGVPILKFYARQSGIPLSWDLSEMPWNSPPPSDIKYVLMPAVIYTYTPASRDIAQHWKVVWSFKSDRAWELRLYEKPNAP